MDIRVERTIKALKRNHFNTYYVENPKEARDKVLELIPEPMTIGIGDSATVRQLGIIDAINKEGRMMINPMSEYMIQLINDGKMTGDQHRKIEKMALDCDCFLTGTNAVTENGELINIDAAGNRVAGMFFGPPKVILVIGTNKIVSDIASGIDRIKNCCAPQHAKTKMRKTPCAVTGKCQNCHSPERLCKVISIIEQKPNKTEINIVLVNMDLGLGWDASWNQERINNIYERYKEQTHIRRPSWIESK